MYYDVLCNPPMMEHRYGWIWLSNSLTNQIARRNLVRRSDVTSITGDFVSWKSGKTLHKSCRYVKMMTKRIRNIKKIMLQRGTNIMANQVKTPIHNDFEWNLTREIPPLCFFRVVSRGIQAIRGGPVCSDWWINGLTP